MKNVLRTIFVFLLIAISSSLTAQLDLSISGGVNLANVNFKNENIAAALESRIGYFVGLTPSFRISSKISILAGVQYSQKGYRLVDANPESSVEVNAPYIDLLPEIEYRVLDFLSLGLGLNYGVKLTEDFKVGDGAWTSLAGFDIDEKNDFGLTGKVKVEFNSIFCFARYNFGLKDISNIEISDSQGQPIESAQTSRNFQLGVGYKFGIL